MNRRLFLKYITFLSGCLAGSSSLPVGLWGSDPVKPSKNNAVRKHAFLGKAREKSRVVQIRNSALLDSNRQVNPAIAQGMINKGMLHLTGEPTPEQAWKSLFTSNDMVGIKVNALGGRQIATHPEVVEAVVSGLKSAGVPEKNIIVWDRLTRELSSAGYSINTSNQGVRCFGTDTGYDPYPEIIGSVGSCFSTIISSQCTALINIPVLKDHDLAGVSLSLKNFYGAIHNPNKYHDNNCDPYVADLNTHPYIKDKLRLVICDAVTMLYHGGPAYKPQWAVDYCAVVLSRDPVAIDRIGAGLIEENRKEKNLPSLKEAGREPLHIATAARKGLGTDDPASIEFVNL